jgi:hypothetical protein
MTRLHQASEKSVVMASTGAKPPVLAMTHGFSMTLHSQLISRRDKVIGTEFMHRFSMEE